MEYIDIETIDGKFQEHIWGGGLETGRATTYTLMFNEVTKFSHGQHIRTGGGRDVINFTEFSHVDQIVVGRLEDFDASRDELQIDGKPIDFYNLPDIVRVVSYKGGHNDSDETQQWLLISTDAGGKLFYTLEGARVDMDGDGGREADKAQEHHFLLEDQIPEDFARLPDARFIDQKNAVPEGLRPEGGQVINDIDKNAADVLEPVSGTGRGDLIAGGLNADTIRAGGGDDRIWGGSGHDMLRGGLGEDTIEGGTGRDQLIGAAGDDTLLGGHDDDILSGWDDDDLLRGNQGSDTLYGQTGEDSLFGGTGDDRLFGASQNDVLRGGRGDDTLVGGAGADALRGGEGADVFEMRGGDLVNRDALSKDEINDIDVIEDFTLGEDRIVINGFDDAQSATNITAAQTEIDGDKHFYVSVGDTSAGFLLNVDDTLSWGDLFAASDADDDGVNEFDETFLIM